MFRRNVLSLAVLLGALTVAATAPPAGAATLGPASFAKATGGTFTVPVHPGGFTVYSSSPAYLVLRANSSDATAALEADAAKRDFPWVAVRTTVGARPGMACFSDVHLVTTKSRLDAFSEGENDTEYNGMFLQYRSWHFRAGATKPADCAPRGAPTAAPSVALGRTSAHLRIDCLTKRCSGTFVSYKPARLCKRPIRFAPGFRGCPPLLDGHFTMDGGLSVNFKLAFKGAAARSILVAINVNGKRGRATPLTTLPRQYQLPPKQHPAALSVTCPSPAKPGSPVTISGLLSPAGPAAPLTLTFIGPDGSTLPSASATTDATGAFSSPFTPNAGGRWAVDAVFAGDRTRTHAARGCAFQATP